MVLPPIWARSTETVRPPRWVYKPAEVRVPGKLILVRHGQSIWNVENLFTGWHDVDLSEQGRRKPRGSEQLMAERSRDIAFTSVLKRAIRTLWIMLDEMDLMWLPVERSWRLNERHYGALQGLDKAQTVAKHGEAQVKIWRRSYDIPPPPLSLDDPRHPRFDPRYAKIDPKLLPAAESLKDTLARVLPYWKSRIAPELRAGKNVLVVAHGNSLRAHGQDARQRERGGDHRAQHPDRCAAAVRAGSGAAPASKRYLGDPAAIAAAAEAVRRQTEKK